MTFLGWDRPLLHSAADWLLDPARVAETPDLSQVIVVVRGARAGRRLLELLALRCAERKLILRPPQIMTPQYLVARLTQGPSAEPTVASPLASTLAWAEAIRDLADDERNTLFRRPGEGEAGLRSLLGLGKHLAQIWSELGGAGFDFDDVVKTLDEQFPNIATFETPRWQVIASLHRAAGNILRDHELVDRTTQLVQRARYGELVADHRVVLAGVAEMPRIVREFLLRLSVPPDVLAFAPETERAGFDELGLIRAEHWNARVADLQPGQVHLAERDRDQALRLAEIVSRWQAQGVPAAQMTVGVPDAESLPRLREVLEARGVRTRWAQGRAAADAPAFQLLALVADYLERTPDEPPAYDAVAALARHPDVSGIAPDDWQELDRFASAHLPARFDPASIEDAREPVWKIHRRLREFVDLPPVETDPREIAEWTLEFLTRVYGDKEENSLSPSGRVAVHAFVLLRDVLADTLAGKIPWPPRVRPADFLHVVLGFLGDDPVPEPPVPGVVEMVGWLELTEDDAPVAAVTSFYEGAVPETISSDPFLPGSLRQALNLGDNAARMARDAYALAAVLASRGQGRGEVVLIAPRFDAKENPVRPSRLLLNGLEGEALARRVWHLAGRRGSETRPPLTEGPGFPDVKPITTAPLQKIGVTAFRDYLESPRKFYFVQVLKLKAIDDAVRELEGAAVGTLMHEALSAFGADVALRDSADAAVIDAFITERFDALVQAQFGRWVQPAVEMQIEEVRRRLRNFARVQSGLRGEGWEVRYVEGDGALSCTVTAQDGVGALEVTGRIDRIDFHPGQGRWRIIDYKTSAKQPVPLSAHFKNGGWVDLQLPLYLKLAMPYAREQWGVELNPDNCELVYFGLPQHDADAGLSETFPEGLVEEAWDVAAFVVQEILRGEFTANPDLKGEWTEPALLALCGQVGITDPEAKLEAVLEEGE